MTDLALVTDRPLKTLVDGVLDLKLVGRGNGAVTHLLPKRPTLPVRA